MRQEQMQQMDTVSRAAAVRGKIMTGAEDEAGTDAAAMEVEEETDTGTDVDL
jgi:hypothetical protein